eukprot:CAMPEP_0174336046 /NCGR_PEP_ID=MMETSP0810-20121108/21271_1 /TAXON_ID=73025 ORGANISM="Eutreptiella gymnastica-like, Strain CCMP1594" /NCGR_SAMPLE_ID=MMETSP0810 /ASSEMBLY_ACC=CAM_ASM_000659 /LENGTH=141 /DNA_ID=CAMNT_0015454793 /DNA_START=206 /DNA_END=628 /DNA_ORIENTATION=+
MSNPPCDQGMGYAAGTAWALFAQPQQNECIRNGAQLPRLGGRQTKSGSTDHRSVNGTLKGHYDHMPHGVWHGSFPPRHDAEAAQAWAVERPWRADVRRGEPMCVAGQRCDVQDVMYRKQSNGLLGVTERSEKNGPETQKAW